MNLRQVELFVAVIEHGGFTAAAEQCAIAQPAVSIAVRRLERTLGVRLLIRERRRLRLTAEGETFLRHAHAMLAQMAAAQRELAAMRALEAGHVSLGAPGMVAAHLLPPALGAFRSQRPGLRLTVIQAGAEEIAARVAAGDLDLGIIADWRTPDGLDKRLLQIQPMVACVAAGSPLARRRRLDWDELLDQPLVLFPRGYYQRGRVDAAAAARGRMPDVAVEAESLALIVHLVRHGHGVATLLAAAAVNLPGVRALALPADATVPVTLCRRQGIPLSAAAEALHAHLAETMGDGAA